LLEHLQLSSVCDPAKLILTSNFSYLFNSNSTYETKNGIVKEVGQYQWQPSGLIIMIGQSETGNGYQSNLFITLLWHVLGFAVPGTSLNKLCKNVSPKPFC